MSSCKISEIKARQIYDSRANPTVEVDVILEDGSMGRALVPSGASTGIYEALELRDGDPERLGGKSVFKAIRNIHDVIAPELIGMECTRQAEIDELLIKLDGTENKSNLGANAILGCSMAVALAAADYHKLPLFKYLGGASARTVPVPMIQIIGGGAHAVDTIDIQDFLVIPMSASTFAEGYEMVVNVYNATKKVFQKNNKPLAIADEGGFWPTDFTTNEQGLELLTEGIILAGYKLMDDVAIALDVAASEFYNKETERYVFKLENREFTREEFADLLCGWVDKYPIISIEDGMSETDWKGSKLLTERLGGKIQLIGDDLFTTNLERIRRGITEKTMNSVLIKMNQIGTITETLQAIEVTKNNGWLPVVSARSGETEDSVIVHLSMATNAGQLKVGSVARSERTAKWNEVIRMEEYLAKEAVYPSGQIFKRVMTS